MPPKRLPSSLLPLLLPAGTSRPHTPQHRRERTAQSYTIGSKRRLHPLLPRRNPVLIAAMFSNLIQSRVLVATPHLQAMEVQRPDAVLGSLVAIAFVHPWERLATSGYIARHAGACTRVHELCSQKGGWCRREWELVAHAGRRGTIRLERVR